VGLRELLGLPWRHDERRLPAHVAGKVSAAWHGAGPDMLHFGDDTTTSAKTCRP
jgi:hypothetical protein